MLATGTVALLLAAAVVVLLYQGVAILFAYQMPRLDPDPAGIPVAPSPKVSVVVVARNEELDLPGTLDDLAAQDYPNLEVVVVDGGSTDGTPRVLAERSATVRRIEEPPLPDGWVGKNWACSVGARATDGPWILFLDADVRLHRSAVRTTVAWAEREGARLASVAPRITMVGFWEKVVLPFYVQMVLVWFRAPRANRDRSRAAMANGQYCLVRRADYDAVGGHAAVRGRVLEDIALAGLFRRDGRRLRIAWAPDLAATRMYRSRAEMFEGLLKNIHGTDFSAARQFGFMVGLVGLFWLPLALLPFAWVAGNLPLLAVGAFLVVALFGKHVAFARASGAPAAYGLLYPIAVAFYLALLGTSLVRGLRHRGVTWKGRTYALRG